MDFTHQLDTLQQLQKQVTGSVLTSEDASYEQTRRGFNLAVDQHPALILVAANAQDIVAGVRFAHANNLGVSVKLTGHGVLYPADDQMLIVTSPMTSVQIDAQARTARVEAGARFQDLLDKSVGYGLAPLLGTTPHVGVVGFFLGGGLGWLSRRYGFAADSLYALDIVTADGVLRRASATENADLFWGLRGGGGNFGVVTALEFALYPVSTIYGGALTYPGELAEQALRFFRDWSKSLPDEMTASIAVMKYPSLPQLPEAIRGKIQVLLRAVFVGDAATGERLVQPWLSWQTPLNNTFHQLPFGDIASIQNDPVDPIASYASSEMFDELDDAVLAVIARFATNSESPLIYSELRLAGGAIARIDAGASAIGNRDAKYYFLIGGMTPTPAAASAVEAYGQRFKTALQPYVRGSVYLNFMRANEVRDRTPDAYSPAAYQRLKALKAKYDPSNMFRFSYQLVT